MRISTCISTVAVVFIAFSLQGCWDSEHFKKLREWGDSALRSTCDLIVKEKVDEVIKSAEKVMEQNCKADGTQDTSECIGKGIAALISVEESEKEKYAGECVTKVKEAFSHANGNVAKLSEFVQDWWNENSGSIRDKLTEAATYAQQNGGAILEQSLDASIHFVCETYTTVTVNHIVLEAKGWLSEECTQHGIDTNVCSAAGDADLNSLEANENEKWSAKCADNVKGALTLEGLEGLSTEVQNWWDDHGDDLSEEVTAAAQTIVDKVKEATESSARLYDASVAQVHGYTPTLNVSLMVAVAGFVGLLGLFAVLRLRHARATSPQESEETLE